MTKKDYEKVARALKDAAVRQARWTMKGDLDDGEGRMFAEVVRSLSYMFKQDNSNFRADKFNDAVFAFRADIQWPKGDPTAEAEIEETFREVA